MQAYLLCTPRLELMEDTSFRIEVPCDNDGFVLLRCPRCGELFKLKPSDIEDDEVLYIHCPSCGLASESFLTQDVIDLALAMSANWALEQISEEVNRINKSLQRQKGLITFEVKAETNEEPELPIMPAIEALVTTICVDCGREAKVSPLLAMSSYTCPFCGIGQFNER